MIIKEEKSANQITYILAQFFRAGLEIKKLEIHYFGQCAIAQRDSSIGTV